MTEKANVTSSGSLQSVNVAGGYTVGSSVELELDDDGIVRGHQLLVRNAEGQVVYKNLRAFLPLNDKMNLIRLDDKVWVLAYIKKNKKVELREYNLRHKKLRLLFDERGKLHPNQESPHYRTINA